MTAGNDVHKAIGRKNRIRLGVCLLTAGFYLGFSLGWGALNPAFAIGVAQQSVPLGVILFIVLVFAFMAFEWLYLVLIDRFPVPPETSGVEAQGDADDQ